MHSSVSKVSHIIHLPNEQPWMSRYLGTRIVSSNHSKFPPLVTFHFTSSKAQTFQLGAHGLWGLQYQQYGTTV